jgi:hypothetical protein
VAIAAVSRIGWISAGGVAIRSSSLASDQAQDKDLAAGSGLAQDKSPGNGPARGNGLQVESQAQSGLPVDAPAQSDLQVGDVTLSVTSDPAE